MPTGILVCTLQKKDNISFSTCLAWRHTRHHTNILHLVMSYFVSDSTFQSTITDLFWSSFVEALSGFCFVNHTTLYFFYCHLVILFIFRCLSHYPSPVATCERFIPPEKQSQTWFVFIHRAQTVYLLQSRWLFFRFAARRRSPSYNFSRHLIFPAEFLYTARFFLPI